MILFLIFSISSFYKKNLVKSWKSWKSQFFSTKFQKRLSQNSQNNDCQPTIFPLRSLFFSCTRSTPTKLQDEVNTPSVECKHCAAGFSWTSKTAACQTCLTGKYQDQNSRASVTCNYCTAGTEFTSTTTSCEACTNGRYQTQSSTASVYCSSCSAGQKATQPTTSCSNCVQGECSSGVIFFFLLHVLYNGFLSIPLLSHLFLFFLFSFTCHLFIFYVTSHWRRNVSRAVSSDWVQVQVLCGWNGVHRYKHRMRWLHQWPLPNS